MVTAFALAIAVQSAELPLRLDRDIVTLEGKTYGLMPADYVVGHGIGQVSWSRGSRLKVVREAVANGKSTISLLLYNAAKKSLATYEVPVKERLVHWVALDDGSVLIQTQASDSNDAIPPDEDGLAPRIYGFEGEKLYRGASGKLTLLWSGPLQLIDSDGRLSMAVVGDSHSKRPLRILAVENGTLRFIETGVSVMWASVEDIGNKGFYLRYTEPNKGRDPKPSIHAYNQPAKTFQPVDKMPERDFKSPPDFEQVRAPILKATIEALYVKGDVGSEFPIAIVAGDTNDGSFSWDAKYLYYIHEGHVFVREVRLLSAQDIDTLRAQDEARRLLSQVKQVGVGFAIYGADHADVLPGRDAKVTELLMPYLQDERLLQGFVYTFAGGNMASIAEPTKTILGYVEGKYGRAVVFADASARWEPRKP